MPLDNDERRILACRICGHLFDGDNGKHIEEMKKVVIENADREREICLPCHLEQRAWPRR